jgi:RNA polymerase sigma factor (sigma-70 family)
VPHNESALSFYVAHRGALVKYARGIVGDRAHAEDVVQEAYIRLSAQGRDGQPREPIAHPVSYLYRIVRNLAFDWVKRASIEAAPLPSEVMERVPNDAPTAEDVLVHRDELRVVAAALAELPERTRIAFNMVRLEGRTLRDVADRLGVSVVRAHQLVKEAVLHGSRKLDEQKR